MSQLYYREYGDRTGSLMLFLHGGGVSGWMWDKQIQHFHDYHCIVPDLPEQGKSHNAGHFSISYSAKLLLELIEEKANNKQVIVIGFSLGAQILIEMMSVHNTIIDFAIINSALVQPSAAIKKWIRPSVKLTAPLIKQRWFAKLQAKTLYVGADYFERYYKESSQMHPDTLIRILEENMSFSIPEHFEKSTARTLVTVGEQEKSMMKHSATKIVATHRNCEGIIISKIGHGLPIADAERFNHIVESWIMGCAIPEGKRIKGTQG